MKIKEIKNKLNTIRSMVSLHESGKGYQIADPDIPEEYQLMTRVTTILNRGVPKRQLAEWILRQESEYFSDEFRRRLRTNMSYEETVTMALAVKEESTTASQRIRDTAADWGSTIHNLIESLSYDSSVFVPEEFSYAVNSWYSWLSESKMSILATEQPLYFYDEETHVRYCGTADLIALTEDKENIVIADYKSGKRIYATHSLQNSAYSMALKQLLSDLDYTGQPRCMVIKLPKNTDEKFLVRESSNVPWQEEVFYAMAENQLLVKSWESNRKKWLPLKKEKVTSDV